MEKSIEYYSENKSTLTSAPNELSALAAERELVNNCVLTWVTARLTKSFVTCRIHLHFIDHFLSLFMDREEPFAHLEV